MDEAAFERRLQDYLCHRAAPLSGWALRMALDHDDATGYPVVVSLHRATDFRRAAVIAVLASKSTRDIQADFAAADPADAMRHLFHENIRSVLRKCFGGIPGLATALGKMDGEPFEDPGHYEVLLNLLQPGSDPVKRKRALALRHASTVNSGLVCGLARLDAELVHPELAHLFDSEACADTANGILRYVQALSSTAITQEDILVVSSDLTEVVFRDWAERLVARKADRLPAGPLDDHPSFVALKDATAFASIGKEYRNCLADHVLRAAVGRAAFYVSKEFPGTIVELQRYHHGRRELWALQGVHARGNRRVVPKDRQDIEALLRLRGITEMALGHDRRLTPELVSALVLNTGYGDIF